MRILFLLDTIFANNSKAGVQSLYLLLKELSVKHDLEIFTYDNFISKDDLPRAKLVQFNFRYCNFSQRLVNFFLIQFAILWLNIRYIIAALRSKRPEIIYCSSSFPIVATIVLKMFFRKSKVVHRIYGTFLSPAPSLKEKMCKYLEYLLFKSSADKYIITDDGTSGDKVARYFGIPKSKVSFMRNGVDFVLSKKTPSIQRLLRRKYNIPSSAYVFISTCRLVKWKRVERLVKAFKRLKGEVFLIIIGDGPEYKELKVLANNSKKILFLGTMEHASLQQHLMIADCYVSAYDFSNLGNSLYEALTCAMPVITISTGETGKVISTKNLNGLIVEKWYGERDLEEKLFELMNKIYSDKSLQKKLSLGAMKYAKQSFEAWSDRIKKEVKILESL